MKLSKRQNAIIVGSILGDAYVQATGQKNARLRYEHGGKQKSYLFWKVKELQPLFSGSSFTPTELKSSLRHWHEC